MLIVNCNNILERQRSSISEEASRLVKVLWEGIRGLNICLIRDKKKKNVNLSSSASLAFKVLKRTTSTSKTKIFANYCITYGTKSRGYIIEAQENFIEDLSFKIEYTLYLTWYSTEEVASFGKSLSVLCTTFFVKNLRKDAPIPSGVSSVVT